MQARFLLPSRMYLISIGFILSLDYLGPLFSYEIMVKLITLSILFVFISFLKANILKKSTIFFLLVLICIFIPVTVTYTSAMLIAILFSYLYCTGLANDDIIYCTGFTITFVIITLLYNMIPFCFNVIELASCMITQIISFGSSLGCPGSIFIPFAATTISLIAYSFYDKSNRRKTIKNLFVVVVTYIIFINCNVLVLSQYPTFGLLLISAEVVVITNLVHNSIFHKRPLEKVYCLKHTSSYKVIVFIVNILFIGTVITLLNFTSLNRVSFKAKNISIISSEEPFANANQEISRKDTIGFGNTPFIFSGFKSYLEVMGHNLTVLDRLSDVNYKQTDVIILIHYNSDTSPKVLNDIKSFVNSGGVVIAFNDHNNLFNATNETNKLLSFSGIKVNDDISDNVIKSPGVIWQNSLFEFYNSPIITQLNASSELNLGVWGGASVKATNLFATPLIIAKNGISDPSLSVPNKYGEYMGNRTFDYGDKYGNIALGYATCYGSGCVAVFGDASYIQVPQSMYNWKLLYNTININDKKLLPLTFQIVFAILLLFILICLWHLLPNMQNSNKKIILLFLCSHFAILFMSYFISEYTIQLSTNINIRNIVKKYNVIDNSNNNYFSTALTKSNSVGGLGYISMTQNQPIFLMDTIYDKKNINKFIIINPCKKIDGALIDELLIKGTDVIIISGKEYSHNITDIMKKYEIDFSNSFIGPIPWKNPMVPDSNTSYLNNKPEFKEAWDLNYNSKTTSPLFEYNGYVPATCTKTGNGILYIIADSHFLDNNNLEGELEGKINNIRLFESIFKH